MDTNITTTRHSVEAVPRGDGYAARCECGDITFGGFTSRSQARAALTSCLAASRRDEFGRWAA